MDTSSDTPHRRRSDLTLLGSSSQELEHKVYTLTFGVDLADITFEGLHNYAVTVSRRDNNNGSEESLTSVLKIGLQSKTYNVSVDGGPAYDFTITDKTLDLDSFELDTGIVDAVNRGIAWIRGEIRDERMQANRRRVPSILLDDPIAVSLLMSSISTLVGGATRCHRQVIAAQKNTFTSKEDYINRMYDGLKDDMDTFTEVAIYRCVNYYMASS